MTTDEDYMRQALVQARQASETGEVPVGAVLVHRGEVVATGHNAPIGAHDPTAHAEIRALRTAANELGNYRLEDCELYVTLEPCPMCAGALLHARLKRVVFGAADPKTGAAGSVLDLFANRQLNHQTQVHGGVLAQDCGALLQEFFQRKRHMKRQVSQPVREDALRTASERFEGLPGYPWAPHYVSDLPTLAGLRMHYLDEGPRDAAVTWLCLHGNLSWSYLYRKMIPVFLAAGHRVVAPDLIGFGKSDKPKKEAAHRFAWHRQALLELVTRLDLKDVCLVAQEWGGALGLTLPMAAPERFKGLLAMNTMAITDDPSLTAGFVEWQKNNKHGNSVGRLLAREHPSLSKAECAAYDAPFPYLGHRAGPRAFASMTPDAVVAEDANLPRQAQEFWWQHWAGRTLMAVGMQDPVPDWRLMQHLRALIPNCPEPLRVEQGGRFLPEWGEGIAETAVRELAAPLAQR